MINKIPVYLNFRKILCMIVITSVAACCWAQEPIQNTPAKDMGQKVFVLCYHRFIANSQYDIYSFSIEKFATQMKTLKDNGVEFISSEDFINNRVTAAVSVLITIDDGDQTAYKAYQEVLKPLNIKPMFAVNPSVTKNKGDALSWHQLQELVSQGCTIATRGPSNTYVPQATQGQVTIDRNDIINDIFKSKTTIETQLEQKLNLFVHSRGIHLQVTKKGLMQAGYTHAFNMKSNFVKYPLDDRIDLYEIPRFLVTTSNWKDIFNSIIECSRAACKQPSNITEE